jgi:hypothetical protein
MGAILSLDRLKVGNPGPLSIAAAADLIRNGNSISLTLDCVAAFRQARAFFFSIPAKAP